MADAINQQTLVLLRMYLELGKLGYQRWQETGVYPDKVGEVPTRFLVDTVLQYVTPDLLPLTQEEVALLAKAGNKKLPAQLRRGDVVFRDPDLLRKAIESLAPSAAAELAAVPGSDTADLEWWAVALSAAGVLAKIGGLGFRGAILAKIAAYIFAGVVAYFFVTAKTDDGKLVVTQLLEGGGKELASIYNALKQAAGDVASGIGTVLIALAVVGVIGVGAWIAVQVSNARKR